MYEMNDKVKDTGVRGDLKGARRATGKSPRAIDLVPDPEVQVRTNRRRFTTKYKLEILAQADQCRSPGEVGALLRREALYSSHLSNWRRLRRDGTLESLSPHKRGPKPCANTTEQHEIAKLRKQNEKLERELEKARTIIEVQKKLSLILSPIPDDQTLS